MKGLPDAPGIRLYGVEEDDVGRLTAWFPAGAGGIRGVP
jgi:hypothetical protein